MNGMRRCVIAGAGISGLALAHRLLRRGVEVLLLERSRRAGGVIRSERTEGFLCEWGPAALAAGDVSVDVLLRELGLAGRAISARERSLRRCVVAGGLVEPLPRDVSELATTPLLATREKLRLLADLVLPLGSAGLGHDESLAGFARRRLGRVAAERLLYPLLPGLYPIDPERTSAAAAHEWLTLAEREHGGLLRSLLRHPPPLLSFAEGLEELPKALAAACSPSLRLGAVLRRVLPVGPTFRLQIEENGQATELAADAVVLATPACESAAAVAALDARLAATLRSIEYAPLALVQLGYPEAALRHLEPSHGFYVPPMEPGWLLGAVFASAAFPGRAPPGQRLLTVRLGGTRHPDLVALPEIALAHVASDGLARLLRPGRKPTFARVERLPEALPQYTLGHRERLAEVDAAEQRHPGLFLTGNAYRGIGLHQCIAGAGPLAKRIVGHLAARSNRFIGQARRVG
ncbi:MAG TPA: protoporphyrinogen oxidase [Polyangia bacterium]|nr:protoporphyrinogen oxidase [Polyangia bacterium]